MRSACPGPNPDLKANVPRITQVKIDPAFIGKLIGKGGHERHHHLLLLPPYRQTAL